MAVNSLKEKYSSYSNKDLIRILRYRKDYTQDAVQVIQDVLKERKVDSEELDVILDEINAEQEAKDALEKASLSYWEKLILISVPILGFIFLLLVRIKHEKLVYNKKMAQSLTYSLLGTIIFAVLIIVWLNR